jgi:glycerol-1-phosphate dehydrogenase [NAD(P)+]
MEAKVRRNFTGDMLEPAVKQTMDKYITAEQLRARLELIEQKWPSIQKRCAEQVIPAEKVEEILKEVGGVYHPSQIGLTEERFHETYIRCQMIRTRYTLLDFLLETGVLQEQVDKLFVGDGFWAQRPWKD